MMMMGLVLINPKINHTHLRMVNIDGITFNGEIMIMSCIFIIILMVHVTLGIPSVIDKAPGNVQGCWILTSAVLLEIALYAIFKWKKNQTDVWFVGFVWCETGVLFGLLVEAISHDYPDDRMDVRAQAWMIIMFICQSGLFLVYIPWLLWRERVWLLQHTTNQAEPMLIASENL